MCWKSAASIRPSMRRSSQSLQGFRIQLRGNGSERRDFPSFEALFFGGISWNGDAAKPG